MVYKKNLSIAINILLFYTVVLSIGTTNSCDPPQPPPNTVCLEVDQELCDGADFSNAILNISRTAEVDEKVDQYGLPYVGDVSQTLFLRRNKNFKCEDHLIVSATEKPASSFQNRYIDGYEINYGWWSKDSYRRYSFADMFEWKYGRRPTLNEEMLISGQQVRQWFNERHTVKRSLLPDDPPRDVRILLPSPINQFCIDLNQNPPGMNISYQSFTGEYVIRGHIEFANGIKCELKPLKILRLNYDQRNTPHRVKIEINPVCSACN